MSEVWCIRLIAGFHCHQDPATLEFSQAHLQRLLVLLEQRHFPDPELIRFGAVSLSEHEWRHKLLPAMYIWGFSLVIDGKGEQTSFNNRYESLLAAKAETH